MNAWRTFLLSCILLALGLGLMAVASSNAWAPRPLLFSPPLPALLFLALAVPAVLLSRSYWFDSSLSLKPGAARASELGAIALMILSLCILVANLPEAKAYLSWRDLLANLALGLAAELCVRVLLFAALRELWGEGAALIFSCLWGILLFVPFSDPKLFLFIGLHSYLLSRLRAGGLFLVWLLVPALYLWVALGASLGVPSWSWPAWTLAIAPLLGAIFLLLKEESLPERQTALLFSYGSLRLGQKEALDLSLSAHTDALGLRATLPGRLRQRQGYPLLELQGKGGKAIPGELIAIRDKKILSTLDAYEGALYERKRVELSLNDLKLETWVYAAARRQKKSKS